MKQISGKMKICIVIIAIVIIAGIGMIIAKGMNKSTLYSKHTRLEITLNDMDKQKVEEVVKEVFGKKAIVQTIGDFEDIIAISVKNSDEEEITSLQEKINSLDEENEVEIKQTEVGAVSLKDIVTPYILPMVIITLLFAIYNGIKYRKEGFVKFLFMPIISVGVVEAIYISIFAILQIPVGYYFMPIAVTLNILTLIANSIYDTKKNN